MRGVEVRLGVPIASVGPDKVQLDDGTVIAARTVVWGAGVKANPLADTVGLPRLVMTMEKFAKGPNAKRQGDAWKPAPLLAKLAAESKTFN